MAQERDRMSDDELNELKRLLYRYAEVELDQWDNWIVGNSCGDVYINISNKMPDGHTEAGYIRLPPPEDVPDGGG